MDEKLTALQRTLQAISETALDGIRRVDVIRVENADKDERHEQLVDILSQEVAWLHARIAELEKGEPAPEPAPSPTRSEAQIRAVITEVMAGYTSHVLTADQMAAWVAHFSKPDMAALPEDKFRAAVLAVAKKDWTPDGQYKADQPSAPPPSSPLPSAPPPTVPPPPAGRMTVEQMVADIALPNDLTAAGVPDMTNGQTRYMWNAPASISQSRGFTPAAVLMGTNPRPYLTWWRPQGEFDKDWQHLFPWMVLFEAADHAATNVGVRITSPVFEGFRQGEWEVLAQAATASTFFAASKENVESKGDSKLEIRTVDGALEVKYTPNLPYAIHGLWGGFRQIDVRAYEGFYTQMVAQLVVWDERKSDDRDKARLMLQVGADLYPEPTSYSVLKPRGLSVLPGVFISRQRRVTNEPKVFGMANLDNVRSDNSNSPKVASMSVARFLQVPPRSLR